MKLLFKFFDNHSWSVHGTLRTLVPFILFILLKLKLDTETLIFMSLMGMMKGDLLSKIIMVGFLRFLVYKPTKSWTLKSILFVLCIIGMHYIKQGNSIEKWILNNNIAMIIFSIIIFLWMGYIIRDIIIKYL